MFGCNEQKGCTKVELIYSRAAHYGRGAHPKPRSAPKFSKLPQPLKIDSGGITLHNFHINSYALVCLVLHLSSPFKKTLGSPVVSFIRENTLDAELCLASSGRRSGTSYTEVSGVSLRVSPPIVRPRRHSCWTEEGG